MYIYMCKHAYITYIHIYIYIYIHMVTALSRDHPFIFPWHYLTQ